MKLAFFGLIALCFHTLPLLGQDSGSLDKTIPYLIEEANIPGLSATLLEEGEVVWAGAFGVKDAFTQELVTNETVFEAASLSKPVVAYVTLILASRGELDLDAPLWDEVEYSRLDHDERATEITARMVLSHTSGLPNWGGTPLELNQDPGSAWNYSGEGFVYLAEILERTTGLSLDELARREVFEPLGMSQTSFVWRNEYSESAASPHDMLGRVREKHRPESANAASSLHTTALDYARFVVAVLNGEGLSDMLAADMLQEQAQMSGWGNSETWEHLAWGLGWGLQSGSSSRAIWHWGDNGYFRCYVIAYPHSKSGLIYFTNSNNGLSIAESLVGAAFDDTHWALKYLDYQTWDQPRRRARIGLQSSFAANGGEASWQLLENISNEFPPNVAENESLRLANFLLDESKEELGVSVLEWSASRFRTTGSLIALAEALTARGDYPAALEQYENALRIEDSVTSEVAPRVEWLQDGIQAQKADGVPAGDTLTEFAGTFGPRKFFLIGNELYYSRDGAADRTLLLRLAGDLFAPEGSATFRLRFERDDSSKVVRVVGLYSDGRKDSNERTAPVED